MENLVDQRCRLLFCGILLVVSLTGCVAGGQWTWRHPGGLGEQQLAVDREACLTLAHREARAVEYRYLWPRSYWGTPLFAPPGFYHRPYYNWYRYDMSFRYQDELRRFFRFCMEAKGWQRVRLPTDAGH